MIIRQGDVFAEDSTIALSKKQVIEKRVVGKEGRCVMRKIVVLICAGIISCAGFTAQAQDMGDMIDQLARGQTVGLDTIIQGILQQDTDTAPQVEALAGPIVVETHIPETNREAATVLIGNTRYGPRLRIDFREFQPIIITNGATASRNGRNGATTYAVVQRIQNQLRLPQIDLEVQNRVAIVSGTVETEHQRRLVASMLRFEPGIDSVRNEITVVPRETGTVSPDM